MYIWVQSAIAIPGFNGGKKRLVGDLDRMAQAAPVDSVLASPDGIDLSDVRPVKSRAVRAAYVLLGTLSVAIGVVGIFVPGPIIIARCFEPFSGADRARLESLPLVDLRL
jgi:hypothetical protein